MSERSMYMRMLRNILAVTALCTNVKDVGVLASVTKPEVKFLPENGEKYIFESKEQANAACFAHNKKMRLCSKTELVKQKYHKCAVGWLQEGEKGYFQDESVYGMCEASNTSGFIAYDMNYLPENPAPNSQEKKGNAGAFCCDMQAELKELYFDMAKDSLCVAVWDKYKTRNDVSFYKQLSSYKTCTADMCPMNYKRFVSTYHCDTGDKEILDWESEKVKAKAAIDKRCAMWVCGKDKNHANTLYLEGKAVIAGVKPTQDGLCNQNTGEGCTKFDCKSEDGKETLPLFLGEGENKMCICSNRWLGHSSDLRPSESGLVMSEFDVFNVGKYHKENRNNVQLCGSVDAKLLEEDIMMRDAKLLAFNLGLNTKHSTWAFASDAYSTKGLYAYSAGPYQGYAFYGKGGNSEQRQATLAHPLYRPDRIVRIPAEQAVKAAGLSAAPMSAAPSSTAPRSQPSDATQKKDDEKLRLDHLEKTIYVLIAIVALLLLFVPIAVVGYCLSGHSKPAEEKPTIDSLKKACADMKCADQITKMDVEMGSR